MSTRRINKQQSARIEKKKERYLEQHTENRHDDTNDGLILTRFGRHALVETSHGPHLRCAISQNMEALVAGDRVLWQRINETEGIIISCYPRQSVLSRPNPRGEIKPIAANIDQILIVVAPKPEISWPLLDSYLIMTEYLQLSACIVLNKTDLPCDELKKQLLEQYKPLGYPILFTNGNEPSLLLEQTLNGKTSVFVGQSGVGKSSLISRVLPPGQHISTGAISERTELGTHTTSNSYFYHLPTGGALIDSPGVREFGLQNLPITEIASYYREFKPYLTQCKFRNCTHINQAHGCALIKAVQENKVALARYDNYIKILSSFKNERS